MRRRGHEPVQPEGEPAVRGCAVLKGFQEEPAERGTRENHRKRGNLFNSLKTTISLEKSRALTDAEYIKNIFEQKRRVPHILQKKKMVKNYSVA